MKERIKKISMKINMKYLFVIIPLILIVLLIVLSSFYAEKSNDSNQKKIKPKKVVEKTTVYTTKDAKVDFTFKDGYKVVDKGEYDLYAKNDKKQIILAVFTYNLENYEEKTGKEILDAQVGYFLKTRNNMKVFKNEISKTYADKTITRIEYSGKSNDSSECVYVFSAIEFNNVPNYVVYVSQVLLKSDYEKYIKEINNTLISAKIK